MITTEQWILDSMNYKISKEKEVLKKNSWRFVNWLKTKTEKKGK